MYKLWANVDGNGNIVNGYGGFSEYVGEPLDEVYDYYFEVTDVVYKTIGSYYVLNGSLTRKEGA